MKTICFIVLKECYMKMILRGRIVVIIVAIIVIIIAIIAIIVIIIVVCWYVVDICGYIIIITIVVRFGYKCGKTKFERMSKLKTENFI